MSRSTSVFVRHTDIREVVNYVSDFIGHSVNKMEEENSELYSAYVFGCDLRIFHAHDFEDDLGILFTKYATVVDLQSTGVVCGFGSSHQFCRSAALLLAGQLTNHLQCESIVVEDYQHLIAIFPQKSA